MTTDISANISSESSGPAGFENFNAYADANRGAFLNATAPAAYTAIQQRADGAMSFTAATDPNLEIGATFRMDGQDPVKVADAPTTDSGKTFNSDLNMSPNLA